MAAAYGAAALVALLTLTFPSPAQEVPIQDRGSEAGAAFTPSHSLENSELIGEGDNRPRAKTVADGLYMSGVWLATYAVNFSTVSITLPYIYNYSSYYTGTLRLSYWATTSYPARGAGFTGYRLATFASFSPLAPGYHYYDIVRSSSMLVPPNGTYWLILALEEYDPAYCSDASGFCLVDSLISASQRTFGPVTVNLAVTQNVQPSQTSDGKDVIFDGTVSNVGSNVATNVKQVSQIPTGTDFVWASPECTVSNLGIVTCSFGTMVSGATRQYRLVFRLRRPSFVAGTTHRAEVTATETDSVPSNNVHFANVSVVSVPNGIPVQRYRLYSDVTKEHLFTTDANEYNILGAYVGTWVQEGTVGKVLNNPGQYNGVQAVPYYRLYDLGTRWHHWTTDANEYYTLGTFPGWVMEGVDGYILPTPGAGTRQLYRLNYPALGALHHWTIDLNEYNVLTTVYGWVGEGGSGFVIQ